MRFALAIAVSMAVHLTAVVVSALQGASAQVAPLAVEPKHATKVTLFDVLPRVVTASPLPPRGEGQGEGPERQKKTRAVAAQLPTAQPPVENDDVSVGLPPSGETASNLTETSPPGPPHPDPLPQGGDGIAFDVSALHAALAASAQRCYPAAARRYGLTGEATVDFCLDGTGSLRSTQLAASSGQGLLDTAARECVISGAMPMPAQANGGCYTVPVRFGSGGSR